MTIAQELKIKDFPFNIRDKFGNRIYCEEEDGYWEKWEYHSTNDNLKEIRYEDSVGYRQIWIYNNCLEIYYKNSDGFWRISEYDVNDKEVYYKDSDGVVEDNRPNRIVTVNLEEIAEKFSIIAEQLRIKE